ncbi:hypothetical protein CRE_10532 [Caenorhabditis remanei]|uniref:F-box domain-containing protein n=1 Tax=Caenorhabditis remanei TaxID=31234 RepID=E3N0R6_CAERE|nr:hypothetical protein CRE_10532 [Caenorhabditis remanei]
MTTPFPLLRLPRLALIPVFEQMEEREIIKFSLLSKRASNLSKSLRKLSASFIHLLVERDHLDIGVRFEMYREVGLSYYFCPENAPNSVNAVLQKMTFTHGNIGLTATQLLERVQDVTNCESLKRVDMNRVPRFDVCVALFSLKNIRELHIGYGVPNSFAKKALGILSPVTTEITLYKIPFESREEFQTFLKSNLNFLAIHSYRAEISFKFSMDDVLVANALKLKLREVPSSVKGINQFFLNWLQNKWDSRMEHFSVNVYEHVNENNLLKGLNAVPCLEQRTFHYSTQQDTPPKTINGGFDVRRDDGKLATIKFEAGVEDEIIDFYVWP